MTGTAFLQYSKTRTSPSLIKLFLFELRTLLYSIPLFNIFDRKDFLWATNPVLLWLQVCLKQSIKKLAFHQLQLACQCFAHWLKSVEQYVRLLPSFLACLEFHNVCFTQSSQLDNHNSWPLKCCNKRVSIFSILVIVNVIKTEQLTIGYVITMDDLTYKSFSLKSYGLN